MLKAQEVDPSYQLHHRIQIGGEATVAADYILSRHMGVLIDSIKTSHVRLKTATNRDRLELCHCSGATTESLGDKSECEDSLLVLWSMQCIRMSALFSNRADGGSRAWRGRRFAEVSEAWGGEGAP